jgi:hypothetical protein
MISKCIAFLAAALLLANCCAMGSGCAPTAETPLAWDGLGSSAPIEEDQPVQLTPKKHARAKRDIVVGSTGAAASEPNRKIQSEDEWEQQHATDLAEDAKLKRKLIICSACK